MVGDAATGGIVSVINQIFTESIQFGSIVKNVSFYLIMIYVVYPAVNFISSIYVSIFYSDDLLNEARDTGQKQRFQMSEIISSTFSELIKTLTFASTIYFTVSGSSINALAAVLKGYSVSAETVLNVVAPGVSAAATVGLGLVLPTLTSWGLSGLAYGGAFSVSVWRFLSNIRGRSRA